MAAANATALRRDAAALVRVVEDAAERWPAARQTALHEVLQRTLQEARRLDTPAGAVVDTETAPSTETDFAKVSSPWVGRVALTPEQRGAYFPVSSSPRRAVGRAELAQADAGWRAAGERGHSYRAAALEGVGPVLTPGQAAARLGVSAVTLNNWRRARKLVAFRFDDHQYLYPAFQFVDAPTEGERGVLRHLGDVLALLPFRSDWAGVQFFLAPAGALGGKTPLDVLRSGGTDEIDRLRELARYAGDTGA